MVAFETGVALDVLPNIPLMLASLKGRIIF